MASHGPMRNAIDRLLLRLWIYLERRRLDRITGPWRPNEWIGKMRDLKPDDGQEA
jgi:hypothetical protein